MMNSLRLRSVLALGASATALMGAAPVLAQTTPTNSNSTRAITEVVVTAQRRSEALQDVPVAVSAFSADTLKAQRLDGGDKLVLSVPNVNYSRSNFGGYNFQIRGIGTKVVSPTGDPGVSFNIDNLPVAANHLGDTDFYDVDRVEVLRGPQGTLYGRSATGGAVNVITAKPNDRLSASITGEYGNYNTEKFTGYVNLPIGDTLSLRLAGFYLNRDGFGHNSVTGNDVDGRDLGSGRATLSWKPTDNFRASLMLEHFEEKDSRNRVGKQLCYTDNGPATVGGVATSAGAREYLNQGCLPGSLYGNNAYGTVNTSGTLGGILTNLIGLTNGNALAGHPLQNHNLHDIESAIDPIYEAKENLAILNMAWDLTPHLTLESLTGYNSNTGYSYEDYNRLVATVPFGNNPAQIPGLPPSGFVFPGGVVPDPQVGTSNLFRSFDYGQTASIERTEELRLTSSFSGPFNFSVGAIYINSSGGSDYDVESNGLTAFAIENNAFGGALLAQGGVPALAAVDPSNPPTFQGHNYYDARFHSSLKSTGTFGEVYYQLTDTVKITAGLRYTDDKKQNAYYPIELLEHANQAATPNGVAQGYVTNPNYAGGVSVPSTLINQAAEFTATTGRFNIDWTPHLSFTNKTLVYATYSRGYQGGGFNTPSQTGGAALAATSPTFAPVYVDAYEVGTKNVLLDGALVLNLTGFYYNEKGYQISTIVNKSAVNTNINADIYGAELESLWSPVHNLTLNANIGYLHTKITSGSVLDQSNLTQGDPNLSVVKASDGSNCVVNTTALAGYLAAAGNASPAALTDICSGTGASIGGALSPTAQQVGPFAGLYNYAASPTVQTAQVIVANNGTPNVYQAVGLGIPVNVSGKELPNSPDFTVSIGAQYVMNLTPTWQATARADYYWQDDSYARIFNTVSDHLKAYDNVNATLTFANREQGLNVQLYIKNAFNKQPITDTYLTDASSGLFTNVFTLDPRTYGISLTKKFQ